MIHTLAENLFEDEGIQNGQRDVEFMISVAYGCPFANLFESLEWHAEARDLPESTQCER